MAGSKPRRSGDATVNKPALSASLASVSVFEWVVDASAFSNRDAVTVAAFAFVARLVVTSAAFVLVARIVVTSSAFAFVARLAVTSAAFDFVATLVVTSAAFAFVAREAETSAVFAFAAMLAEAVVAILMLKRRSFPAAAANACNVLKIDGARPAMLDWKLT